MIKMLSLSEIERSIGVTPCGGKGIYKANGNAVPYFKCVNWDCKEIYC